MIEDFHWGRYVSVGCFLAIVYLIALFILHRRDVAQIKRIAIDLEHKASAQRVELSKELTKAALLDEHERTRAHISAELNTIRGNTSGALSNSKYVVDLLKKLAKAFGVNPP